ncbi:HNH endonuclease, partial [Corynebacterium striatum]
LDHYYPRSTHPELTDDPANFRAAHSNCNRSRGKGTAVYALGQQSEQW